MDIVRFRHRLKNWYHCHQSIIKRTLFFLSLLSLSSHSPFNCTCACALSKANLLVDAQNSQTNPIMCTYILHPLLVGRCAQKKIHSKGVARGMARIQAPVDMLPFRVGPPPQPPLQEHSWKLVGDNENVVLVYYSLLLLLISYMSFSLPNEPYSKQITFIHAN